MTPNTPLRATSLMLLLGMGLTLAACTEKDKRLAFDGHFFRAKSAKVDKDNLLPFVVTVQKATQSIEGARQAGAHEGHFYCIKNFGTSRIKWDIGPDSPDAALVFDKDALILRGECNP